MFIRKKIIFYLSTMIFVLALLSPEFLYANVINNHDDLQSINARGAILVEENSMRILWEKNPHKPMPMASTTKIMTCMLALEKGDMDDIVVASKRAAAAPKVKLYLKPGERQRLEDLLYALMLQSSNDAAVAIAEHIGGSVEEFCSLMTERARELGANSTCFKTANGLDSPGHMSTPYDLALITKHAYSNEEFTKIITTPSRDIPSRPLEGSNYHKLQNKNRFLESYSGANGVKTGYTGLAGHCFVGGAERNDMQLFAVVLASGWGAGGNSKKYTDTMKLLDYGFDNYKLISVKEVMDKVVTIPVVNGNLDYTTLVYGKSLKLPLREDEEDKLTVKLNLPESLRAPIDAFQPIATANVYIEDSLVASLPVVATDDIEERNIKKSIEQILNKWINLLEI